VTRYALAVAETVLTALAVPSVSGAAWLLASG
jgi:hypothetical protein